jgi:hypothetical protein
MAKELNEDTTLKLSIKTLAGIAALIFTLQCRFVKQTTC